MNELLHWNALYTRTNCEKKVSKVLEKRGIPYYCPLNQVIIEGANQKKSVFTPLFPSVIFIQLPPNESLNSLARIPSVINPLYKHHQPAEFPAAEISTIRHFLEAHETVTVTKTTLGMGNLMDARGHAGTSHSVIDNIYTLDLPSVGYALSAKAKPVINIKLLRKNSTRYRTTERLAFILGFKTNSSKFQ